MGYMVSDEINQIWTDCWNLYHESYYQERLADKLALKWQRFDYPATFLVTITASGSAITGWALWDTSTGKIAWIVIAGVAALVSCASTVLGVSGRIKLLQDTRNKFSKIRISFEVFRARLSSLDESEALQKKDELIKEYQNAPEKVHDFAINRKFEESVQDELDKDLRRCGYAQQI
jgi:hypothetical protein